MSFSTLHFYRCTYVYENINVPVLYRHIKSKVAMPENQSTHCKLKTISNDDTLLQNTT